MRYMLIKQNLLVKIMIVVLVFLISLVFVKTICYAKENEMVQDEQCITKNNGSNDENINWDEDDTEKFTYELMDTFFKDFDYSEVQNIIDELDYEKKISFSGLVKNVIMSGTSFDIDDIFKVILEYLNIKKEILVRIMILSIVAALFTNFVKTFNDKGVSQISFLVVYLLIFLVLITSFMAVTAIADKVLKHIIMYMKALVPVYSLAIMYGNGSVSAIGFCEVTLVCITIMEWFYSTVVIPMVNVYVIVVLADNISNEQLLSEFSKLICNAVKWFNRAIVVLFAGMQVIREMTSGVADEIRRGAWTKGVKIVPIVGNSLVMINDSIIGAGHAINSAVGVAGIIVIVVISAVPLLSIGSYIITYKLTTAIIQPISDKRIINCIEGIKEGAVMLFEIIFSGMVLFFFSIAIVLVY